MVLFNCQYKTLKPTGGLSESIRPNLEPTSCKETSLRPLLANGVSLGTRQPCEDISSESCLGLKESPIFQVGECQRSNPIITRYHNNNLLFVRNFWRNLKFEVLMQIIIAENMKTNITKKF